MSDGPDKPPRVSRFPAWFEPAVIVLLLLTAWLEYRWGQGCWAYGFAGAALVFSATSVYNRLRPK